MSITIVLLLLAAAIALILIEIFLIPGVGIPGIIGLVLMAVSLYLAYTISMRVGHYTLVGGGIASLGLLALALRSKTWSRVSVHGEIDSKIDYHSERLKVGDQGKAVSRLNPMGKVMFGEEQYEARSRGEYIDAGSLVEIINIEGNKITVKTP